ncbi:MAG: restriction endonuclease subunit S, partial [Sodaliphilus sp.]|nr:restriction endonuclease subunit S [Sodaliphilus sp.]
PFVDSELGPIPQGWKVGTLGDIANIIMGQSPAGSSYNERGNGVIFYQGRTEFGFRFPNVRLYTTMPKRYAEPMSILLSVRAPVGDINVAIEKCCIGRGLASISSKRGLHSFLLYLVKSLKNRLEVFNGEGTVFGSINKNTLMQFKIIIPPIEMQEKFNEIIQRHDCMVLELHKEIINLSTQRDTLLPKLMSGEIKL